MSSLNERAIIDLLAKMNAGISPDLICGIGDDCAVIKKDSRLSWLVTMDTLVESVHFDLNWHPPYLLGRKAVAVNVSDIAAMGGKPVFVFLSLGLPSGHAEQWLVDFSRGVADACVEYGCILAGGDTVRSPSGVLITMSVIGEAPAEEVVLRNGAEIGDSVWVSGALGQAAAGLELCLRGKSKEVQFKDCIKAHLDPQPRLQLGMELAARKLVHAMMDLSDGLATDLAHLCSQSRVGAVVELDRLPASASLIKVADLFERDMYKLMLAGGEDYELIFTASVQKTDALESLSVDTGVPLTRIGTVDVKIGVRTIQRLSREEYSGETDISYMGFDHFAGDIPNQ